jgi:acetyl esterase/lipase
MVKKMYNPDIVLVDQASGFNWQKNTISDKVHPNPEGADHIAKVWFDAIKQLLPEPPQSFLPEILSYKKTEHRDLNLHVFKTEQVQEGEKRPAIIYFFGGGWSVGTPLQFYRECAYYTSKGMVAIAADYRIAYLDHSTPFESVEDAKDAIRWIRENAEKWNIDPERIVGAGASAGGHLAATAGILNDKSEERKNSSSKPNLLLLYYPVVDNSEKGYGTDRMKKRYMEISPLHNIRKGVPPALFIVGTEDHLIPVETAQEFKNKMKEAGSYCELHLVEGAGHPIFYYAKDLTADYYTIRKITDDFLLKYKFDSNRTTKIKN